MSTYLITGATSGIGQACAQTLLAQGHELVIVCRNMDKAHACFGPELTSGQVKALTWDFDHNEGLFAFCAKELKDYRFSGFIHGAGQCLFRPLIKSSYADAMHLLEVDFLSFTEISRALMRLRAPDQELSIVAISSISSLLHSKTMPLYGCIKSALNFYITMMAKEVTERYAERLRLQISPTSVLEASIGEAIAPDDVANEEAQARKQRLMACNQGLMVRINAVAPNMVDTAMMAGIKQEIADGAISEHLIPSEAVVDTILQVMNNRFLTGQVICLNNGTFTL